VIRIRRKEDAIKQAIETVFTSAKRTEVYIGIKRPFNLW
jgi:hypothetical protein